jgi:SM-20-related protein
VSATIRVIDDFLPSDVYERLESFVAAEPMLYGTRSHFQTDPHGHWSRQLVKAGQHNLANIAAALEANAAAQPVAAAWRRLRDSELPGNVLIRCYLNGYTYGTDGYFHTDSDRPEESTAILYLNERWDPDWAGETVFLGAEGDIVKSVLPKRNRAVIFPGNVWHAGRGVSRKCLILRQNLVFKTRRRRSAGFETLSSFLVEAGALECEQETGSLHDHLVRVFALLEARGYESALCFAGGLQALYNMGRSPQAGPAETDRAAIASRFGWRAERLAYLCSVLDRPRTLDAPLEMTGDAALVATRDGGSLWLAQDEFDALRTIECATLLDRRTLSQSKPLSVFWEGVREDAPPSV